MFKSLFVGFFILLSHLLPGQVYHFLEYNLKDGLLSAHINDILEDPDGFIWIATEGGGISRFDGVEFEHFNPAQVGLAPYMHCLTQDSMGGIWVGGDGGIALFRHDTFTTFLFDRPDIHANDVVLSDSVIIVSSNKGVYTLTLTNYKFGEAVFPGKEAYQILKQGNQIYIGSEDGILVWDSEKWVFQGLEKGLLSGKYRSIALGIDGKIWLASDRSGLYTGHLSKWYPFSDNRHLLSKNITFLSGGELGSMFMGTIDKGLLIWQSIDSSWQTIGLQEGLAYPHVTSILFDRWDNAWVGTGGGGLFKYTAQDMIIYDEKTGLANNSIKYLKSAQNGRLFVVYSDGQVELFDQNHPTSIILPDQIQKPVTCWSGRENEKAWFGTSDGLIHKFDGMIYTWKEDPTSISNHINDLYILNDSSTLVCTDNGITGIKRSRIPDSTVIQLTEMQWSKSGAKRFFKDKQERLWYYGANAIGFIDNEKITVLHSEYQNMPVRVVSIAEGTDGTIYLGSRDQGLFYVSGLYIFPLQNQEKAPSAYIRAIVMDRASNLWIATVHEVIKTKVDKNRLTVIQSNPGGEYVPREIGLGLGIADDFGNVFFGSNQGLIKFPPQHKSKHGEPPNLILKKITIGDQIVDLNDFSHEIQVPYREKTIEINVKAIDHRYPEAMLYLWRINQTSDVWSPGNASGQQIFYNLSAGSYLYEVRAENAVGSTSNIVKIPFYIRRPWWGSIPIQVVYVLFTIGTLGLIYRRRISNMVKKQKEENEKLSLQNKLLTLQQQALRLQMNPHFIFNVLQSIESKIALGSKVEARKSLQDFAQLMRSMLEQSRKEYICLDDEIDALNKYLEIEQKIRNHTFKFQWQVEDGVDTSLTYIPTMVIQPFIENAIKHGQPKEGMGLIDIVIKAHKVYLEVEVNDNGPGIIQHPDTGSHRSAGVDVTTNRLQSYFKNSTAVKIENRKNEKGQILGASAKIKIPIIDV